MAMSLNIHTLTDAFMERADADYQLENTEARRGGRMPMVGVKSSHGRLLDLSHCGALIHPGRFSRGRKLKIGSSLVLTITFDNVKFVVESKVVRREKVKGIGLLFGLEFFNITDHQRENILHVGQSCRPKLIHVQGDAA